jgi:asparagine synthase (glutamine-hydrolysing)
MVGDALQAFTASFPGLKNDETDKVEELCRLIEISPHKTFPMEQGEIEKHLTAVARNMEAPFFSPAVIVYDMLMKLVRSSNVHIVLDGLGGDELFGGFEWYIPLAVRDNLHSLRLCEAMNNINGMRSKHGKSLRYLLRRAPHRRGSSIRSMRRQRKYWHSDLFQSEWQSEIHSSQINGENYLDHALKVDLLEYNTPRWLHMSDRISMANSVVCRSPFLDFRLVEFAFTLDNNLKIRNAETKYILRQAKRGVLPASIVDDFRKIRLSGPGAHWLKGSLKDFALSLRDEKTSKLSSLVRTDALRSVIDDFFNSKHRDATRIWRIVNSEAFLRAYS